MLYRTHVRYKSARTSQLSPAEQLPTLTYGVRSSMDGRALLHGTPGAPCVVALPSARCRPERRDSSASDRDSGSALPSVARGGAGPVASCDSTTRCVQAGSRRWLAVRQGLEHGQTGRPVSVTRLLAPVFRSRAPNWALVDPGLSRLAPPRCLSLSESASFSQHVEHR